MRRIELYQKEKLSHVPMVRTSISVTPKDERNKELNFSKL